MADKQPDDDLIDAATVLLARPSARGPELFMVVRNHQIDFASGALVFPGGKIDAGDGEPRLRAHVAGGADLSDRELALRIGAIREAFEECGILLARETGKTELIAATRLAELADWRDRFNAGTANMLDFVTAEGLELAVDVLGFYAHWVTPDRMKKRFDTYFFLAEAPLDHIAEHDGGEGVDSVWITAADALAAAKAGERVVIFPTRLNLQKFAEYKDIDAARAACGAVVTVKPFIEKADGKHYIRIRPDAGYGDPREELTAAER